MSADLLAEFPEMKGFSHRNVKSIRQWYRYWSATPSIGKQPVAQTSPKGKQLVSQLPDEAPPLISQIPWGHNILLIQKLNDPSDALFYVQKTIENSWSRSVLTTTSNPACTKEKARRSTTSKPHFPHPKAISPSNCFAIRTTSTS